MTVETIIRHNGEAYSAEIMTIKKTSLGEQDHGIWTATLHCEGNGPGVGLGGYCLDTTPDESLGRRAGSAFGLDHVMQICKTVGVDKWEDLPFKRIYVLSKGSGGWGSSPVGLANIDTGKVLIFKEHADLWLEKVS